LNKDTENQCEQAQPASFTVSVALAANEVEALEQLFIQGPTWDGNIVSKSGRDQLFDLKLASRVEGYSFLTAAGIRLALSNRVDRKKDKRRREHSNEIDKYRRIAEIVAPTTNQQEQTTGTVMGLGRLLEPERPDGHI
jgi:hypothetical protein